MKLIDVFRSGAAARVDRSRGSFGPYSWPDPSFSFNGFGYGGPFIQTMPPSKTEEFADDFGGHMRAALAAPPVFGAQNKRARYLSQARFAFRDVRDRKVFGAPQLSILEKPWVNGTSSELISKMEWHVGLAGNAYVWFDRPNRRLKVLNPDWVSIVLGSQSDAADPAHQLDAEVVGYVYTPGGIRSGSASSTLLPQDVAHWSPIPDPLASFRGMSWVTPAIREVQGDVAASTHKLKFFENGATPNLVVSGIPAASQEQFGEIVEMMESQHAGVANAYRTLYLAAGADASVVGADLKQIDFKATVGTGETRIAFLSEVPASLLGISEGMQGSTLNSGNYAESRRSFIDGWLTSELQSLVGALAPLVMPPNDRAELWFTTADMPIVREDAKNAADIEQVNATTIRTLVDGGFEPQSVVEAVTAQDMTKLKHTGKLSVQLQAPGEGGSNDDGS